MKNKTIICDDQNRIFDKEGLMYKEFSSDFRKIRYYTLLIVQKAPHEIKEINLLEQQISELIKNAVKHGNKCRPEKLVRIWFNFSKTHAKLIIEDEGEGFQDLEKWNIFNEKRNDCFLKKEFELMSDYISFRTQKSDESDGGNALFAALEYWDGGIVFNTKKNAVGVMKNFYRTLSF